MKNEQHIEWNSKAWIGIGYQKRQNISGVDDEKQSVDAIEWSSTRQHEQDEEKNNRQGKKTLHKTECKTLWTYSNIRAEESEELDPKQLHFGCWMVKSVLEGTAQIEVIKGGVAKARRRRESRTPRTAPRRPAAFRVAR